MTLAPAGASRSSVTRTVFSITLEASPGSTVETTPTRLTQNGATPQLAVLESRHRVIAQRRLDAEWNEFHCADHLAFDHRLEGRQGGKRNGFVHAVDPVHRLAIDHQHTGLRREQIGAASERPLHGDAFSGDRFSNAGGGDILGDIALIEPRHDDLGDAGMQHRDHFVWTDQRAFLQDTGVLPDRMNRDAADGVFRGDRTELHAGTLNG